MQTGIKRTQRDYTLAFKLAVVEQVEKGDLSYTAAQERYGIQGSSTVLVWMRKHGRQSWSGLPSSRMMGSAMTDPSNKELTPDQRIKQLEVQLKHANEKAKLFEAVLDVLKKDYGVSVAKKRSGKSSHNGSSKG